MRAIRCIIAGCRNFRDLALMERSVIKIFNNRQYMPPDIEIVSGGANGADKLGEEFAMAYSISVKRFPANWKRFGSYAGHMRNSDMAFYASQSGYTGALIAFWDNCSKGTKNMIENAIKRRLEVYVVDIQTGDITSYDYEIEQFKEWIGNN